MKILIRTRRAIPVYALVDDDDYDWLNETAWYLRTEGYVVAIIWNGGNRSHIAMHRLIAMTPPGMLTDHINGDRLDNRRINLRWCTIGQSNINRGISKRNKVGCAGVRWHEQQRRWHAFITLNGRQKHLGCFSDLEEAKQARINAAKQMHGEFSRQLEE